MEIFILSYYDPRSEATYAFGPFNQQEAETFIAETMTEDVNDISIMLINPPERYGTGQALTA